MPAFIVAENDSLVARIRGVLNFRGQDCPSSHVFSLEDAAYRLGRESNVELVVFVLPANRERGLGLLPTLAKIAPGRVLAVGPASDTKLVLRALRGGAKDYVDTVDLEIELETALTHVAAAAAGAVQTGRLIAVLAPNGGSGSSTIAANVAASLTQEHKAIGLIDMKLESGDLAALLDLRPTFTMADLCQNASRLDKVMFERSLAKHESGVHLLAPPQHLADVGHVRPDGVAQAVDFARARFPYVVVDLDHSFRDEQLVILRQADVILVVFRLDFTSLRNVHRTLEHLEKLGISGDAIQLVVNRRGQPQEVPPAKAEEALRKKIAHFVPEDTKAINRANNHGVPVVLEAPTAKVSKSLIQLALSVNGRHGAK